MNASIPQADISHRLPHRPEPSADAATLIFLAERNLRMLRNDLFRNSPLRLLETETAPLLSPGGFGAVMARAGVGKTAIIVQIALDRMFCGKKVLHVSLTDPVKKVALWYEEVYRNLLPTAGSDAAANLWEELLTYRFIMTFKAEGFSVPILDERLNDLSEQDIFSPDVIIVDGFPFDTAAPESLQELKRFAEQRALEIWFTVRTHRHETTNTDGTPVQLDTVDELFERLLHLKPDGTTIHVDWRRDDTGPDAADRLTVDAQTMLLARKD